MALERWSLVGLLSTVVSVTVSLLSCVPIRGWKEVEVGAGSR